MIAAQSLLGSVHGHRELVAELVKRELRDRHTGQLLGALWAYGHPLLLMLMYSLLFAYVFPTRVGSSGGHPDFAVNVLIGIVSWLAFQDLLARSTTILTAHASLVKQIIFPVVVLPIKTAIASALPYSIALLFTIGYAAVSGTLTFMVLTVPFLIAIQLIAMTGVALMLSALGIFFRDLRDIVTIFCAVNLFAQPILFNPYVTPSWMNWVFHFNPFSYQVWCWQDALYFGAFQHPAAWIVFPLGAVSCLAIGYAVFSRLQHGFGDAL
ncbi:ABC transporter permease [Bradyrhizobium elkanii]|uniref:Lipopolysaccharide transport system permease protein n=1 Tax=Bradyrhizobium elkanii TaxID=29448 RepID=A0ABV4F5B7_BRAEL|nr:lipopolysaccharide transport system permease protein [Bradyrhizobium elkanii]MCP1984783.1 lipopolysaccharide transport system permease protein [Bradyrhizobium elkanii]MCS3889498.1 lipopolysaccharide transport system permease protein [Bradyrhizobium elkanii]MCS4211481.1 lipopolysaccharide transport system permease protein [Bradyrhizobium elkanii]MCW2192887.1 lipopolysaccharide transport system permease protein [Bradyrhizobium elkanii]